MRKLKKKRILGEISALPRVQAWALTYVTPITATHAPITSDRRMPSTDEGGRHEITGLHVARLKEKSF